MIRREKLRRLRNQVLIDRVIEKLDLPSKLSGGYLRFLCPLCREFNTATNPDTNLARCFRCKRNFNPIDMIMALEKKTFLEAVTRLETLLD